MGLILLALALIPFLSLAPLHWFWTTGSRGGLGKVVWLALSAGVFWPWLALYLSADHPGRRWLVYALLLMGSVFCVFCVWSAGEGADRARRALFASAAFPILYMLNLWCTSLPACAGFHSRRAATLSNARFGMGR